MIDRDTVTNWLCEHGVDNTMTLAECITAAQFVAQKAVEGADNRAADIVREKAMKMEREAQEAEGEGDSDSATSLRATAWVLSSCETAIRNRGIGGGE